MTSRSSFFKLLKEDLRQRLWTIVLAAIVFILPVPIYIGMRITNYAKYGGAEYRFPSQLAEPMATQSFWLVLVTVVGALICAVSGYGYLFSKKKVDFFHSLPVKRETLFAVRYINGVLIYLVPYLVMMAVSFVIIAVGGHWQAVVFTTAFKGLAVHLLGYLTVYTTFILCVTFVGNIVVFFAVSGWTFGITAIALLLYNWFEEKFFYTFSYIGDVYTERIHSLRFLCPGYFYVMAIEDTTVSLLLQQLAFTAVLAVLTLLVYRVRPSDGAGKAIAFPILKPVIRISVELLAGALAGMMFYEMADSQRGVPGWMIFGGILGVVLSHMLIQSIFYFDIRKCFAEKWSMVACVAGAVVFTLVMRYDVFGYDTYLPKQGKLESVGIEVSGFDGRFSDFMYDGETLSWMQEAEEMEISDMNAVYPYLEALVEDTQMYADYEEGTYAPEPGTFYFMRVEVAYHLKNGKTEYRRYRSDGLREELFAQVFATPEYKETHYASVYTVPEEWVQMVTASCAMNIQTMNLSAAEKAELMSILRREHTALTLKEKLDTQPLALLTLIMMDSERYPEKEYGYYEYTTEIPVYASFTETLRFLEERGFVPTREYAWTGLERMRVTLPDLVYKESDLYTGEVVGVAVTEEVKAAMKTIAYPENWDYGEDVIPVDPEDFERLYELCYWEELYGYGDPTYSRYENYRVALDVPQDGYNMYTTYRFIVPKDADLSFLFD